MKVLFAPFTHSFLRSFAQIMLQGNTVTGFLFCIGIGINSPTMLLGSIIATLSGLATATLFKYESNAIHNGLYGFNSALVGLAVFYFLPVSVLSLALVIFGGALTAFIMRFMLVKTPCISALTAPFVISTWFILAIIETAGIDTATVSFTTDDMGYFYSLMRGVGQIMFQGYWLSGVIFICGLLCNSFKVATWAVIGSGLGMLIAGALNFSEDLLLMGIYGFNASLVAIAFADRYTKKPWTIFIGITLAVLLTKAFELITLPALTAPFVLASWLTIGLNHLMSQMGINSNKSTN